MDEFLNELYGTSEIIGGDDLEKQAAAEFLVKMAEEEGVNLDDLSDDEVAGLLSEIEGGIGKQAGAEVETDEAQEKLAEADFLGRAMAHAYVNELNEIEKEAGRVGDMASKGYQAVRGALGRATGAAGRFTGASDIKAGLKARKGLMEAAQEGAKKKGLKGKDVKQHVKSVLQAHKNAPSQQGLRSGARRMATRVGAPAAGLAALGAGAAAMSGKDKKSFNEEFEAAARERAYEMLAEAGYDIEKVASADIDTVALQMLEQAGYPVNWG